MEKDLKIAIVGGGIGGLTLALSLEHLGFKNYKVFEQASEFKEVGAAISVWPNALRVFQKLGIYEELSRKWGEILQAYIMSDQGDVLSKLTPRYELPAVCIHRADLLSILLKNLSSQKLFSGHKLAKIVREHDKINLFFENGTSHAFDVLVGADGINSIVRQEILADNKPIYRNYNVWRGIATLDIPQGYASETWGKGARVGIVPIKGNRFGWWTTLNEGQFQSDEPEGSLQKLERVFGSWHDPIPRLFRNSSNIIKNNISDRKPVKGWYKNRAGLLGDAAHPTTPNLGQGACMAIEGAYLLANCINKYDHLQQAFARYEALHYPRTRQVVVESLMSGKMGQIENALLISLRNITIKMMPSRMSSSMLDKYFNYDVTKVDF